MADPLRQTYGEVFFLTNGLQRDPYGLANFHPASNVNRLDVYLEDGVSTNVVMVNFRADGKNFPTSVFFPTLYGGTVQKVITGEATARTFAKYSLLVPPQVLQWNANGSAPLGLTATVVQTAGDGLLGAFATYTELTTTHTATQILYDDGAIAYVYSTEGINEYGFYMVSYDSGTDTYSWVEVDNPVTQINMVDTKQYNIVGMQIQKGNLPSPTHGVTISDAYIRYILAYLAQINDIALANQTAIGDSSTSGSIIFRLDVIEADIDAIIAGTQDITYDPTISGLVSTTIKEAVDEVVGRLDTAEEDIVALEGRMDTAEEDIDNLETFQNVTVPATYETIANADIIRGRTTDLENGKEDKSNKATDFSIKNDTLYPSTKAVGDYAVEKTSNPVKTVTVNPTTYVVTVTYYNDSVSTYDLPAEMAFVSASYDNDTKDLTFTLQNGSTVVVPLDDIITGLATEAWVTSNFYSKTQLDAGQLDNRYYTEDEADALLGTKIDEDLSNYIEKLTLSDNDKLPINDSDNGDGIKYTTFKHIKDQIVIAGEVFDATVNYAPQGLGSFKTATTKIYTLTLQSSGDYRTTIRIPETDTFVWVKFPDTSANANLLRVSLNNGTNYYNVIKNGARFKASIVSGQLVRLQFDGTQFIADIHNDVAITETYGETIESTYGLFNPQFEGIPLVKEIQGRTIPALENLITNGDFGDGTTGWTPTESSHIVTDNVLENSGAGTFVSPSSLQNIGAYTTDVLYVYLEAKTINTANYVGVNFRGTTTLGTVKEVYLNNPVNNQWNIIKQGFQMVGGAGNLEIRLEHNYSSNALANGSKAYFKNVHVFNLTASHGVTATSGTAYDNAVADIEAMLALNGGYISTTSTTHVENTQLKSVGKNLFDGQLEVGDINATTGANAVEPVRARGINKISVQSGVSYYLSATSTYLIPRIFFYSGDTYISFTTYDTNTVSLTIPSGVDNIRITFRNATNSTITATDLENILSLTQLEQGTVATTYAPHITETQLFNHGRLSRLPNGVHDKVRYDNGAYVLDRYVQEYTLVSGIGLYTVYTNIDYYRVSKPTNFLYYLSGSNLQSDALIHETFDSIYSVDFDNAINVNNIIGVGFSDEWWFGFVKGTTLEQAQNAVLGTKIWYQLATPLLATEVIDVDGTLIQESTTTVEQLQDLPTTYLLEYAMNTDQTVATLVQRDKVQQLEIDSLETRTTALETRKETNKEIIFMSATDWATYTRVDGEVYGVWDETTGVITFYYGVVGV